MLFTHIKFLYFLEILYGDICFVLIFSGSSTGDLGEVTPCNASPNLSTLLNMRPISKSDVLDNWTSYIQSNMLQTPANTLQFFHQFQRLVTVGSISENHIFDYQIFFFRKFVLQP